MKRIATKKKLILDKSTIRKLTGEELKVVAAGVNDSKYPKCGQTWTCDGC